jgi:hypothetical protein
MKQAEIWFHMKKVSIYEDICTSFYILIEYADPRPLAGIPVVNSNLA